MLRICVSPLLNLVFSLYLLFSLFLLYLWGPLPFSVLNNCYFCVSVALALFDISAKFVIFVNFITFVGPPSLVCPKELLFLLLLSLASFVILLYLFLYVLSKCFVIFVILAIARISGHISLTVSYHISQKPNYKKLGRTLSDATEY